MTTSCSAISARSVRNSPFRESEWDRRLDHLLQDLENSATSVNAAAAQSRSYSSERKVAAAATDNTTGYAQVLSKSRSTSSLGATPTATDNMLKDLDAALKASSNYIESHRTVQMPNGTQEFHEYRSTTTSGNQNGAMPRNVSDDFNLERQGGYTNSTLICICTPGCVPGPTYDAKPNESSRIIGLFRLAIGQHDFFHATTIFDDQVHLLQGPK